MYEYVHVNVFACGGQGQGSDSLKQKLPAVVSDMYVGN